MRGATGEEPQLGRAGEVLYENDRTRVIRVPSADGIGTVITKEFLGPDAHVRLQHELRLLERLEGVPGVIQPVWSMRVTGGVVLQDVEATSLAVRSERIMGVDELLSLALAMARLLAAVHARGVIHKDITPANVLVCGDPAVPFLIDFDLATTFAEDRPVFTHQNDVTGTLDYLAPEQSGRTGWAVDQRADLYGLGATLYELATGRTPFEGSDALQLIHAHLAQAPIPPKDRNSALPRMLSDIVLRLLQKDPDRRYQSATGLAHDLARLSEDRARGVDPIFVLAERDFPQRLTAPTRLVGRDREIGILQQALEASCAGDGGALLVGGGPGVGKSSLLNELRPLVTGAGGWLVTGKFEKLRQDEQADAVRQAVQALIRLLLAEPEDALNELRPRITQALGANIAPLIATLPELAALLGISPQPSVGDPLTVQARLAQGAVNLLRIIASPQRPVVMVIDDLQWAGPTPLAFLDAVVTSPDLVGVLVVGSYRDAEVDAAHPLTAMLSRWERLNVAPERLQLRNLLNQELGELLADVLRLSNQEAAPLAEVIAERTKGNPYDSLELVNALRRDGALVPGDTGWTWDPAAVRQHIGSGDVIDLLNARLSGLPVATQAAVRTMACLGAEIDIESLALASDSTEQVVEEDLRPALEDGLLLTGREAGWVKFRHDRVQQAALSGFEPAELDALRITLARRLAGQARYELAAAEQYLAAEPALATVPETSRVIELFLNAARHAKQVAGHQLVERYAAVALDLARGLRADAGLMLELSVEHHAALCTLGRLPAADAVFAEINNLTDDPLARCGPTVLHLTTLTGRNQPEQALELGLALLRDLGVAVPIGEEMGAAIGAGLQAMYAWVATDDESGDLARPEYSDRTVAAVAATINSMLPPALFVDHVTMTWLVVQAAQLWAEHGPAAALVGPLAHTGFITSAVSDDYQTGAVVLRRILTVARARHYDIDVLQARFLYALSALPWSEPLEEAVDEARATREELLRIGDARQATGTFFVSVPDSLDCAGTLDEMLAEVDSALALAARTGDENVAGLAIGYRQFCRALRGETAVPGGFSDDDFDEEDFLAGPARGGPVAANYHYERTLAAALFGDSSGLSEHSGVAMTHAPSVHATYPSAIVRFLRCFSLIDQARSETDTSRRNTLLDEVVTYRNWLVERSTQAPTNLGHLVDLLDAEIDWLLGHVTEAGQSFDTAMRAVARRRRPWHQAFITERAGQFYLVHGMEKIGHQLLREARDTYAAWGATAKVADLERRYPDMLTARPTEMAGRGQRSIGAGRSTTIASAQLDLLGILKASQALSSETDLDRLRERVKEVLRELSGATEVRVLFWNDDDQDWHLSVPDTGAAALTAAAAAEQGLLPFSAFQYVERTRQTLIVDDAVQDDRFRRDPYFAELTSCSLLVVPILGPGGGKAMLVMENRLSSSVFTADRLDGVMLIAGQLSVSLDNALLYASLERKVRERTRQLAELNVKLEKLSVTDALTGLANRRKLMDRLAVEWERALRSQQPIAVAMIDVDQFKLYNDHYGHPAGDQCLRVIGAVLHENVRTMDVAARYGGEEFAIVLPGANSTDASHVAERVRAALVATRQPHEMSIHGIVTISVGIASMIPTESSTFEELIEQADENLYFAKQHGRNQVAIASA
jgi:diguanylate cyclase (GGDEF)-like protein